MPAAACYTPAGGSCWASGMVTGGRAVPRGCGRSAPLAAAPSIRRSGRGFDSAFCDSALGGRFQLGLASSATVLKAAISACSACTSCWASVQIEAAAFEPLLDHAGHCRLVPRPAPAAWPYVPPQCQRIAAALLQGRFQIRPGGNPVLPRPPGTPHARPHVSGSRSLACKGQHNRAAASPRSARPSFTRISSR